MKLRSALFWIISLLVIGKFLVEPARRRTNFRKPNKYVITEKHYIKTSQCHMPFVHNQSQKYRNIPKEAIYGVCSKDKPIIQTRFDKELRQYVLQVNDSAAQSILKDMKKKSPSLVGYNCTYRPIERIRNNASADGPIRLGKEVVFWNGYAVPRHIEAMQAACRSELHEDLQSDTFAFVQPRKIHAFKKPFHRRPSVIMFGMDNISRMNFRFNMPRVFKHLRTQGWFEMEGYTRLRPDTLSHLMALLTGYSPDAWENLRCTSGKFGCLKTLPLIWKRFQRKGYVTAYGEGVSNLSMFNIDRMGFFEKTVHFFTRSLDNFQKKDHCIDRRLNLQYFHDYLEQFVERHTDVPQSQFGFFWADRVEQNNVNAYSIMDAILMDHLARLKKLNLFAKSIVMLFSDKGAQEAGVKRDILEESQPMLFIWLPPWFRALHPEIVQALRINGKRLTTAYDLHLTLHHLLELGERWPQAVQKLIDCPTCQTLLAPVPENRTCADVGITEQHCPCDAYKPLKPHQIRQLPLGTLLVKSVNKFLYDHNLQEMCSKLTLKAVDSVLQRVDIRPSNTGTYRVVFTASPNDTKYSATTRLNYRRRVLEYINVGAISRLDSYRNGSECMTRLLGRKFCICQSPEIIENSLLKNQTDKEPQK
ncbi:hypothetical protein KR018_000529, partial [Drosophila ironensis]